MAELPSVQSFISILQKCRNQKDIQQAKRAFLLACKHGLDTHEAVGNYIVPMFVECGSMIEAEKAFNSISHQNVFTWTSMILGYVQCGRCDKVMELYNKMCMSSVHPNSHTFVYVLKSCSVLKDSAIGQVIHLHIRNQGLEEDVYIGSALIDMYSTCGLLKKAQEVFDIQPFHDAVLWNTLIVGYVDNELWEEALVCFERMKLEHCCPNLITYTSTLRACAGVQDVYRGQELHMEVVWRAFESEPQVANTLIDMYTKCNCLSEAENVLDKLLTPDVISWNALISGHVEYGQYEKALELFEEIQLKSIFQDAITFMCILRACAGLGLLQKGQMLDMEITKRELKRDTFIGNCVVDMYAKCGSLVEAQKTFDLLPFRDVVSWNSLISGYVESQYYEQAFECFEQMQQENVAIDAATYVCIIKACTGLLEIKKIQRIHMEITLKGFEKNLFIGNSLVDMYGKYGLLLEAETTFNKFPGRDVMLWNSLIAGYTGEISHQQVLAYIEKMQTEGINANAVTYSCCLKTCANEGSVENVRVLHDMIVQKGLDDNIHVGSTLVDIYTGCKSIMDARAVFDNLHSQDVTSWNVVIAGYVECGFEWEAIELYEKMSTTGVSPNEITFVCTLKSCGNIRVIEKGKGVHVDITCRGLTSNLYVANALLDMYAECGSIVEALDTFKHQTIRDIASWNTIIKGCSINDNAEMAMLVFRDMKKEGLKPDAITFTCLLTACSRSNLVSKGQELFRVMSEEYGIEPSTDHYNCMVDLFARSGCFYDAERFSQIMPSLPSEVLWTALLTSSKTFQKTDLGFRCFEELVYDISDTASADILVTDDCKHTKN